MHNNARSTCGTWKAGDLAGVLLDLTAKTMKIFCNGKAVPNGTFTNVTPPLVPVACVCHTNSTMEINVNAKLPAK